jgi:hypothetical protein
MATIGVGNGPLGPGIVFDFRHDEVQNIISAESIAGGPAAVIPAILGALGAVGWIGAAVVAGVAATIAIHKAEFQQNDQGNGVEVCLPGWAIPFGLWGVLTMSPLPAPASATSPSAASHGLTSGPPSHAVVGPPGPDGARTVVMSWR